ncbi:MAG TPA: phosphohydrolase, partial [Clostridium sp.]|nr:phosphohydrolase [Clostridium sp.]
MSTQRLIEDSVKHIQDVYTYDVNISKIAVKNIEDLFETVVKINKQYSLSTVSEANKANMEEKRLQELKKSSKISSLSDENYTALLSLDEKQLDELKTFLISTTNKISDEVTIRENRPEDIVLAQGVITTKFTNSRFPKNVKELGMAIEYSQVKPNFFIDYSKTEELKEEAKKAVKPVIIKKDQIIA